ncbi:MAG: hypothetical protein II847_04035 [Ruminobacter sp.]|uniref:Uncharacterized protein n=1 Tax=Ruminobacter amylophilus TaxID=867 RepID=A0A662ZH79_9GAMM|nr:MULTISPECIES: hypothetical protein [Ruminobacter]MBQ3775279.1 hypothetical protein [Ruminobacter sp.]SFP17924.1 hypothetical protein SAMN02910344_00655 [Ruminobacter amylophilus]
MNIHKRKMIAPVVITVVGVVYFFFYFVCLITTTDSMICRILMGIIPLSLIVVMLAVCMQRIREINEGEEDDLGKY